jgi:hypothetical protein
MPGNYEKGNYIISLIIIKVEIINSLGKLVSNCQTSNCMSEQNTEVKLPSHTIAGIVDENYVIIRNYM